MLLNGSDIGLAHVATGPLNFALLVVSESLVEELINGFSALSAADPYDAGSIQIIDDGGILTALTVGDFINANALKIPNPVSLAQPVNGGGVGPKGLMEEHAKSWQPPSEALIDNREASHTRTDR